MKKTVTIVLLLSIIALSGCTTDEKNTSAETEISTETESNDEKTEEEEFYSKYGSPVVAENHYDAEVFAELLADMKSTVNNENLQNDLQQIIDNTKLAAETHEMEYANNIYKLVHDMDYFLLRYGPDDVGSYVQDKSMISRYYGTLSFYD